MSDTEMTPEEQEPKGRRRRRQAETGVARSRGYAHKAAPRTRRGR